MNIGHTGITWGIPGDVAQAYHDVADLGYQGFETFTQTILTWNGHPSGYQALVSECGIPTVAGYCHKRWIDPAHQASDLDAARQEAAALAAIGGHTLVVQAGPRSSPPYSLTQFRTLAYFLNELGRACADLNLRCGIHPHTGTAIETRSEIDAIMELLDPRYVGFAPDTGQIAKGGSDILEVLRTYHTRLTHVHLKDWNGQRPLDAHGYEIDLSGYVNYMPIGLGILPMREILDFLDATHFTGWINVELDGTPRAPRPPREAALLSREYLAAILGSRSPWSSTPPGAVS